MLEPKARSGLIAELVISINISPVPGFLSSPVAAVVVELVSLIIRVLSLTLTET